MNTLYKVTIPLQKTVTFSFEIDGKKVEVEKSAFTDAAKKKVLESEGAVLSKGSLTAPSKSGMYPKDHTYGIPGIDTHKKINSHPTAIGLFKVTLESKAGPYGTQGKPIDCRLLLNNTDIIANNPTGTAPFEDINGFKGIPLLLWTVHYTPSGQAAYTPRITSESKGAITITFDPPSAPPPGTPTVQPTFSIGVEILINLKTSTGRKMRMAGCYWVASMPCSPICRKIFEKM
jgi:hypothetical protein